MPNQTSNADIVLEEAALKKYHKARKEQDKLGTKTNPYTVFLPSLFSAIGTPTGAIHYTRKEGAIAFHTPPDQRTQRQNAIIKQQLRRKIWAYQMKTSASPQFVHTITRVLTDIDNVEDIISTASWVSLAAGMLIPVTAEAMLPLSAALYSITVPLNAAEAALSLATGPAGIKRAVEDIAKILPGGEKVEGIAGKIMDHLPKGLTNKIFKPLGNLTRKLERYLVGKEEKGLEKLTATELINLARKKGMSISTTIKKLTKKQRIYNALPSFGKALEAAQAAQTITGYGLILGPFFGAITDTAWAGYRYINGQKVKFYMPWEKPDFATYKAAKAMHSASKILRYANGRDNELTTEALSALHISSTKVLNYWKNKDYSQYIGSMLKSDADMHQELSQSSADAMASLNMNPEKENNTYLYTQTELNDKYDVTHRAYNIYDEMQAIEIMRPGLISKIQRKQDGTLSGAYINLINNKTGKNIAENALTKTGTTKTTIRPDLFVTAHMMNLNILPRLGMDYGSGIPGFAWGHNIQYSKAEVLHDLNKTKEAMEKAIYNEARRNNQVPNYTYQEIISMHQTSTIDMDYDTNEIQENRFNNEPANNLAKDLYKVYKAYYPYFWKTQRTPENWINATNQKHDIKIYGDVTRQKRYYSWYFDIYEFYIKVIRKITNMYMKGEITLNGKSILKHIRFPEPGLHNWETGKYIGHHMNWTFQTQVPFRFYTLSPRRLGNASEQMNTYTRNGQIITDIDAVCNEIQQIIGRKTNINIAKQDWIIDPKELKYNNILEHTFNTFGNVCGWIKIPAIPFFMETGLPEEIKKIKRRASGSSSIPAFTIPAIYYFFTQTKNIETFPPWQQEYWAYKNPPVWIATPAEADIIKQHLISPPNWYGIKKLRDIFHNWMLLQKPDQKFDPINITAVKLKELYDNSLIKETTGLKWPTKEYNKLLQQHKGGSGYQTSETETNAETEARQTAKNARTKELETETKEHKKKLDEYQAAQEKYTNEQTKLYNERIKKYNAEVAAYKAQTNYNKKILQEYQQAVQNYKQAQKDFQQKEQAYKNTLTKYKEELAAWNKSNKKVPAPTLIVYKVPKLITIGKTNFQTQGIITGGVASAKQGQGHAIPQWKGRKSPKINIFPGDQVDYSQHTKYKPAQGQQTGIIQGGIYNGMIYFK